jgi:hypothetical protein
MQESTEKILENCACLFLGVFLTFVFLYICDINWERRFTLYHIRNELRKEMPRAEAEEIINRHQAPFINKRVLEKGINLTVHLGMADNLSLWVEFSDDKVVRTNLRGEDNPQDVPRDAPPDIE